MPGRADQAGAFLWGAVVDCMGEIETLRARVVELEAELGVIKVKARAMAEAIDEAIGNLSEVDTVEGAGWLSASEMAHVDAAGDVLFQAREQITGSAIGDLLADAALQITRAGA